MSQSGKSLKTGKFVPKKKNEKMQKFYKCFFQSFLQFLHIFFRENMSFFFQNYTVYHLARKIKKNLVLKNYPSFRKNFVLPMSFRKSSVLGKFVS